MNSPAFVGILKAETEYLASESMSNLSEVHLETALCQLNSWYVLQEEIPPSNFC